MTDYNSFFDFNCHSLNEGKIKQYVDLMKKKYISFWNQTLQHSQKRSFYYTFKKNYSLSAYLDLTRKSPSRKSLVNWELAVINFGLKQVHTTKYLVMRGYVVSAIEDETHFLLDYPSYSSIRDRFFSKIEPKIPFLRLLSHETLLSHLMNCTDCFINIQLISFISSCFEQETN